ncbi:MAG TPA: hypothetical protein VJL29_08315 [Thermoguttaceae bacterium]|nr:hypothetical protein [Thermoguttaceae bacterium]
MAAVVLAQCYVVGRRSALAFGERSCRLRSRSPPHPTFLVSLGRDAILRRHLAERDEYIAVILAFFDPKYQSA